MITSNPHPEQLGVVLDYNGSTAVPIASEWAITAAHTGIAEVVNQDGVANPILIRVASPSADLALLRVENRFTRWHPVCRRPLATSGEACIMAGYGQVGPAGGPIGFPRLPRWGTNYARPAWFGMLATTFDDAPFGGFYEAQFVMNDSGGGVFLQGPNAELELAGVAVQSTGWHYGASSYSVALSNHLAWIDALVMDPDLDGDGVVADADFWDFLTRFHARRAGADFNNDGRTTVQDIFDFLFWWRKRKI